MSLENHYTPPTNHTFMAFLVRYGMHPWESHHNITPLSSSF